MIKILDSKKNNFSSSLDNLLLKRKNKIKFKSNIVIKIIRDIKKNGDKALLKYEKKFGKNSIIFLKPKEIQKQIKNLDKKVKKSIDLAYSRIFKFHSKQKVKNIFYKDKLQNKLGYKYMPIDSVGIYVPGGTASYPSTVLMNAIPAIIAGTKKVVMANPRSKGKHNPGVLYAAKKCGIKEIYSIGGAQAIAALAYGTKKIKKVNKIVGPGNLYVATAKKEVFGDVGIDMIAGPTEILIIADRYSNPKYIAADLIAQAEHDIKASAILVTDSNRIAEETLKELKTQSNLLPRKKIINESIKRNGKIYVLSNLDNSVRLSNELAPEHLQVLVRNPNRLINKIRNAGSIFVGELSAEAFGDYVAGPSHVLPTSGNARFSSPLSVLDFLKYSSYTNEFNKILFNVYYYTDNYIINLPNKII